MLEVIARKLQEGKNVLLDAAEFQSLVISEFALPFRIDSVGDIFRIYGHPVLHSGSKSLVFHHCEFCQTQDSPQKNNLCSRCGASVIPGSYGIADK